MSNFLNERFPVTCPNCGSTFNVKLRDVRNESTVRCPKGHLVRLLDEGNGVKQADKEFAGFERDMKRLERDMDREFRRMKRRLK